MQTRIHAAGPTGQRSPGLDAAIAAWHAENPDTGGGGGGITFTDLQNGYTTADGGTLTDLLNGYSTLT